MEKWVEIQGYNGQYFVSDNGRVKAIGKYRPGILKPKVNHGLHYVRLTKNRKRNIFCIEKLLAEYFPETNKQISRYGDVICGEIWRDVNGYAGIYQVSNKGRVRSVTHIITMSNGKGRTIYGKELLLHKGGNNEYLQTCLHRDGVVENRLVHRLVYETFIEEIGGDMEINHINGDKTDNRLENLEVVTRIGNMKHAAKTGLLDPISGENHYRAKLTNSQANEIRKKYAAGNISQKRLGKMYGVKQNTVFKIVHNRTYKR